MALEKALLYVNKETKKRLYFIRLTSERTVAGRKAAAVVIEPESTVQRTMPVDLLFGEDSKWEYKGGMVFEG